MAEKEPLQLNSVLQEIAQEQAGFRYDEAAITSEIEHATSLLKRWPVKLLTILGGLLAMSTLLGFLFTAGLYNSSIALLVFGLGFLIGAEALIRIEKTFTAEAMGVSLNIAGYVLLAIGAGQLSDSLTGAAIVLAAAAVALLLATRSAICVFIATLVLNGSLLALLEEHKVYHLAQVLVGAQALVLTGMSLQEAKLLALAWRFGQVYGPARMGLLFALLFTLGLFVHQDALYTAIAHIWLSSLVLITCLLLVVYHVLQDAGVYSPKTRALVYTCSVLLLLPMLLTPSVPGALLVLLSSFYIGHRPGFWAGLLALAYFIVLYYYDLNMTLLAKSGVLVLSGGLLLGGLYLLNRYLRNHEA